MNTAPTIPPPVTAAGARKPDVFERVFNVMASVRLGVCVLVICAAFFALSTIFWQEPEVIVKQVRWVKFAFQAALVFLSLNLFAVTLSRYPWTRLKIGMLVTHAGLIVTFAGAYITSLFGIDGLLTVSEGERSDRYYTGQDVLSIRTMGAGGHNLAPYKDFPLEGLVGWTKNPARDYEFQLPDGTRVRVDSYYARFQSRKVWTEGGEDDPRNPSVEIAIRAGGEQHDTLLPDYNLAGPALFGNDLAIAYISAPGEGTVESLLKPRAPPRHGTLRIRPAEAEPLIVDVQDATGKPQPLPGGYTLTIEKYLPALVVRDGAPVSDGDRPDNPAIRIRVTDGKGFDAAEWLFPEKQAPEFLGRIGLEKQFRFSYEFPERLTFVYVVRRETGNLLIQSRPGEAGEAAPLAAGAWRRLNPEVELTALRNFERPAQVDEPANDNAQKSPAIHVIWEGGGRRDDAWLPFGATARLTLNETTLWFEYTQLRATLPFEVELKDFRLRRYEGTDAPASFESLVQVHEKGKAPYETLISMNNPLQVPGGWGTWKVFQSSYDPETEATSTFSVSYDPGRPIVYFGFISVCLGVFFMFWIKPLLRKRMEKSA